MKKVELRQLIEEVLREQPYLEDEIIRHIQEVSLNDSQDIYETNLLEQLNYNLSDTYDIEAEVKNRFNIQFRDNLNRVNITKGRMNNGYIELKIYWIDEEGNLTMSTPPHTTPKTMNTHMANIIYKFLPLYDKFIIRGNDPVRHRLFQLVFRKFIDHDKWNMIERPEHPGVILLVKK